MLKQLYDEKISTLMKGANVSIFKPRVTLFHNVYSVAQKFNFNASNKIGSGAYAQVYEAFQKPGFAKKERKMLETQR